MPEIEVLMVPVLFAAWIGLARVQCVTVCQTYHSFCVSSRAFLSVQVGFGMQITSFAPIATGDLSIIVPSISEVFFQPNNNGLQTSSDGLQPTSDGLQPTSDGLKNCFFLRTLIFLPLVWPVSVLLLMLVAAWEQT